MMAERLLAIGILVFMPQSLWALSTDFEDLALGTSYEGGDFIYSGNLTFEVVSFPSSVPPVVMADVTNGNEAGGGGLEMNLVRSVGLDFQLPGEVQRISFLFAYYLGSSLVVNGVEPMMVNGLLPLDGTTLGGVDISVTGMSVDNRVQGMVTLDGPIQSFLVGGSGMYIDDVVVTVPEPTGLVLTLVEGLGIVLMRRCRGRILGR